MITKALIYGNTGTDKVVVAWLAHVYLPNDVIAPHTCFYSPHVSSFLRNGLRSLGPR